MKSSYNLRMAEVSVKAKESEEAMAALQEQTEELMNKELKINAMTTSIKKVEDQLKNASRDNKQLAAEIATLRQERDQAIAEAAESTTASGTGGGAAETAEEVNVLHEKLFALEEEKRNNALGVAGVKEADLIKQMQELKEHYEKKLLAAQASGGGGGGPAAVGGAARGPARGAVRGRGAARGAVRGRGAPARGAVRGRGGAVRGARGELHDFARVRRRHPRAEGGGGLARHAQPTPGRR